MQKSFLSFVILAIVIIFLANSLGAMLLPFVMGIIGAYILNYPVSILHKIRCPRAIGAFFAIAIVLAGVGFFIAVAVPFLKNQIVLISKDTPQLIQHLYSFINPALDFAAQHLPAEDVAQLKIQLGKQIGSILTWFVQIMGNVVSNGLALANGLYLVILTPVVMFYLLKDWPVILENIESVLPKKYKATILNCAQQIHYNLGGYARGQLLVCGILAILYSVGLKIIHLDNAVFIGILTGFLSFIPYLGAFIGFLLSVLVSLHNAIGNPLIAVAVVFIIVQTIEGNFLTPGFVGKRIGVHPALILFSLLAGANWLGVLGVIFALPIAAIISTIIRVTYNLLATKSSI